MRLLSSSHCFLSCHKVEHRRARDHDDVQRFAMAVINCDLIDEEIKSTARLGGGDAGDRSFSGRMLLPQTNSRFDNRHQKYYFLLLVLLVDQRAAALWWPKVPEK